MPKIRAVDGGYLLDAEQFYYTKDEQRRLKSNLYERSWSR